MEKTIPVFTMSLVLLFYARLSGAALSPVNLTCEYRIDPLGIDISDPRFGWNFTSADNDQAQSAYELLVSDNYGDLKNHKGNVWATGKVASENSFQIVYGGLGLKSFTRYYWSVRVYDKDNKPSEWSAIAWFETAILNDGDWKGQWIGDGSKQFTKDEDFYQDDRMPLFQKEIRVKKKIATARLYVSGLGYYEAFLNEERIGNHVLDPGWTTHKKEVLYVVHDITGLLKKGSNVAGFMLGNGWWNPLPLRLFTRFNLRDVQQTGRPCVKANIRIRYTDGTEDIIITDESWLTAPGPIIRNNVYLGEHYDARLEQPLWGRSPSGKDWKPAVPTNGPDGKLRVQMQPPVRVTKTIKPTKIFTWRPGVFIVDMGQNFAGAVRIKVKGPTGTRITMKYGEALHPDGSLNFYTSVAGQIKEAWKMDGGPGSPRTAWQEDSYTLKGNGIETWSPRFTFHGFRYIEITGWPGLPSLQDIEGLRMNSDVPFAGEFECSNSMFNKIHQAARWTFLSNMFSVQSDCPAREKMGYGADMVTTANTFLYNFDMSNFYTKAVRDFANEQLPDGGITEIAPYTGIHDRGIGGHSGPLGWQLAFTYLQKRLYEFYGDRRIIEQQYPAVVKQIDFLQSHAIDGLFHWDISDHEALDPKPEAFSASAFYYHHVLLASEFAAILNKADDYGKYSKLAQQIKANIVQKYHVPATGRFDNGTQSAQLFALWYGLTPEREQSAKVLMDEFERHKWHVSSGIFGVMMMFDWLRIVDQNEVAYTIANQKDYPGWGFMLANGATTLWESWEYPENAPSQNHPMFGSIDEWFYRSLLGINALAPGFKKIQIKPQPAGDLTWAKGSYSSIAGKITSEWKAEAGKFTLLVNIPGNTTAEVWVPAKDNKPLIENGRPSVRPVQYIKDYAVVQIGSGEYRFETL